MKRLLFHFLSLVLLAAVSSAVPGVAVPKDSVTDIKWFEFRNITGRLEEEYDRLDILTTEVNRLKNSCEDLRILQFYPERLTKLKNEDAIEIDKRIKRNEDAVLAIRSQIADLTTPLTDAIAMLRELIFEEQEPQMLKLLEEESRNRVNRIITLKREVGALWNSQEELLQSLYGLAGLSFPVERDTVGFDAEFFKVLYSNLGLSSDLFLTKLNAYKDTLINRMDPKYLSDIANIELSAAKKRFERGEYKVVERDLLDLVRRYENKVPLNGVYFYLGQITQQFGRFNEALEHYNQISRSSSYYFKAQAGILQSLYAQGKYSRIDFLFEKLQNEFGAAQDLNPIYYVVCQAYYELHRDKALIDLCGRAEKDKSFYLGILYTLGQSYTRQKDYVTARDIFRSIAEMKKTPASDNQFVQLSRIALAHLDYSEGKYAVALKQYLELLDVEPLFAEALNGIAWCYINLGNTSKAEIALKKLINQAPEEPSGCEALLLLAQNTLKKAKKEWQYKLEQSANMKRIKRYELQLDQRYKDGEIDSSRYGQARRKLQAMYQENQLANLLDFETVSNLYRRAGEAVDLLINSYQSGEFVGNPFKDMRQELLNRIRDLYLRSNLVQSGALQFNYLSRKEEGSKKREKILETVIRGRMFKVQYLMEKKDWRQEVSQTLLTNIDARLKVLRGSVSTDSAAKEEWQSLTGTREMIVRDFEIDASKDQSSTLKELIKLKESNLDDEQEPFMLYYLAEAEYKAAQEEYLKSDEAYERAMTAYNDSLKTGADSIKPIRPVPPILSYRDAKSAYELLLKKYPESRYSDGALYGLMFCSTEEGDKSAAIQYGESLVSRYPKSEYSPQTCLILGEFYFDENKLDLALKRYQEILKYPDSKWFDKALYKIGWTYYRLSDTKRAISAFFYLINEQDDLSESGLDLDLMKASLLTKESIDYIAISFAEADTTAEEEMIGLKKAKLFVRKIRNEFVGSKILHRLGDVYKEQFKYTNALETYKELKTLYPKYADLPVVMYSVIECYEQKGQFLAANEGRIQLFKKYNWTSEWAKAVKDSGFVRLGDSLAEQALLEAASYTYSMALEKKNKDMYRQVIDMYWDYIKTYPGRNKASECHYYIAEILFGSGDYMEAAKQYMAVSQKYRNSKYCETAAMNAIVAAQNLLKLEETKKGAPVEAK